MFSLRVVVAQVVAEIVDLSIAICTYNGANRIGKVLERLRSQQETDAIAWEILIVDNNSTDSTKPVIEAFQAQTSVAIRYVFEAEQGLAIARSRAVREAYGKWVAFLDDDTVPAIDWVAQAMRFTHDRPQLGAFGGQIHGDYEVQPPPDFYKVAVFLAVIERGPKPYRYEPRSRMLPPGAGLVVRRSAWLEQVQRTVLMGRTTPHMLASEDIEAIASIQKAGWEIWYCPDLHLYHQIPASRMERGYLLKLVRGIGLARSQIRMVRLQPWQRPLFLLVYFLNDFKRLVWHLVQHRQVVPEDLAAACETQLLAGSLVSPFYLWFHVWLRLWLQNWSQTLRLKP